MAFEFTSYEKKGRIAYVTINRPEVMNAVHPPASRELSEIWDAFQADDDAWVAIFTGAGDRAFSAGNDLKYTAAHPHEPRVTEATKGGFGGITHRFDLYKPIIAAVNGYALGGGFEMALACDIIVAADHARFGLPEPTVGLMAGAGGAHRLPRHVPLKVAMGMMLTGRHVTAQEAEQRGLVNQVVPLADLLTAAEGWANQVLACAPSPFAGPSRPPTRASPSRLSRPLRATTSGGAAPKTPRTASRALSPSRRSASPNGPGSSAGPGPRSLGWRFWGGCPAPRRHRGQLSWASRAVPLLRLGGYVVEYGNGFQPFGQEPEPLPRNGEGLQETRHASRGCATQGSDENGAHRLQLGAKGVSQRL